MDGNMILMGIYILKMVYLNFVYIYIQNNENEDRKSEIDKNEAEIVYENDRNNGNNNGNRLNAFQLRLDTHQTRLAEKQKVFVTPFLATVGRSVLQLPHKLEVISTL